MSLFSGLNNLRDVTLDPQYATVCGYTDIDPDQGFTPALEGLGPAGHTNNRPMFFV